MHNSSQTEEFSFPQRGNSSQKAGFLTITIQNDSIIQFVRI